MKTALIAVMLLAMAGCASPWRETNGGGYSGLSRVPEVELSVVGYEGSVDLPPIPKAQIAIFYPWELRRAGVTGEVLATATIEENGSVSSVVIDHASQAEFAVPVTSGLPRCAFFPAKRDGLAIKSIAHCKIRFIMDDE